MLDDKAAEKKRKRGLAWGEERRDKERMDVGYRPEVLLTNLKM